MINHHFFHRSIIFFLLILAISFESCHNSRAQEPLYIASAANFRYPAEEIIKSFESRYNIPCELITASSGKLTAQIIEGAPFDVFLSADEKYPNLLREKNLIAGEPNVYAIGKLIFWSFNKNFNAWDSKIRDLRRIQCAIPDPNTAPYGFAAMQVLERSNMRYSTGYEIIFGESVNQTNQFIESGSVDFGITSASSVINSFLNDEGNWSFIPDSLYTPIQQSAVVVKGNSRKTKAANQFLEFLSSRDIHSTLIKYQYELPEQM